MKNITALATLLGIIILMTACNPFDRSGRSFMNFSLPGNESRVVIHGDNISLDIRYSGDIVFNDEETAIEKISPGGYIDYKMNDRRLLAEPSSNGGVMYKFYNDDVYEAEEGAGKRFLAEAIHEMISQGMFAKGRVERLYQEGGVPLLISEAKRIKADHVKRVYLEYILQSDSVSQEDMINVANVIARIGSDDEKRKILEKVPVDYLKDSVTARAYFGAVESIASDNDKTNALKKIAKGPLPDGSFKLLVHAATGINSDNDKANLVREIVKVDGLVSDGYDTLLGLIQTINSDNEKANVIRELVKKQPCTAEQFNKLCDVIATINSDNDKANALDIVVDKEMYSGEQFNRLSGVIAKLNSDHDKSNVFRKLASKNIVAEEDWVTLINDVATVSSDNDKADVMLKLSQNMPRSEKVLATYMKVAKTINSDHDYQRVVKPVQ